MSEDGYGISVLNDCKYGSSAENGTVGLTMLKSGIFPNPEADQEIHEFTYSIYPHKDGWRQAQTVRQAYMLNNPPIAVEKRQSGGALPASCSWFSCDSENVVIESIKKAEDRDSIIVRLYECYNRRGGVFLKTPLPVSEAWECNMLEEREKKLLVQKEGVSIEILPYEIRTIELVIS